MSGWAGKDDREDEIEYKDGGEREKFRDRDSDNGSFRLSPRATLIFMLPSLSVAPHKMHLLLASSCAWFAGFVSNIV